MNQSYRPKTNIWLTECGQLCKSLKISTYLEQEYLYHEYPSSQGVAVNDMLRIRAYERVDPCCEYSVTHSKL